MSGSENATYRQRKEKGGLAPDCSAKNTSMKNSIFFTLSGCCYLRCRPYKRQLLAIRFNCTLNTDPKLKEEINHIMDSVHFEE